MWLVGNQTYWMAVAIVRRLKVIIGARVEDRGVLRCDCITVTVVMKDAGVEVGGLLRSEKMTVTIVISGER